MINPIYHEQTNHHRGWVRNTLGLEEPILLPVLLRGVGLRLSQRPLHKASRQLYQRAWKTPAGRRYLSQTSEAMNEEDTSLYGKNREGKVALCETCAYDGYCRDKIRYYRCRNYIKIKDDYDKNERNVAGDRSDDCGHNQMTHSELLDAIQGFDVMIINGSRNPLFVS